MHAQSCPTLCDPMDCSPPGSSVLGISQARILELVAISFSRHLPYPGMGKKEMFPSRIPSRDQAHILCASCIGRRILYHYTIWEARIKTGNAGKPPAMHRTVPTVNNYLTQYVNNAKTEKLQSSCTLPGTQSFFIYVNSLARGFTFLYSIIYISYMSALYNLFSITFHEAGSPETFYIEVLYQSSEANL